MCHQNLKQHEPRADPITNGNEKARIKTGGIKQNHLRLRRRDGGIHGPRGRGRGGFGEEPGQLPRHLVLPQRHRPGSVGEGSGDRSPNPDPKSRTTRWYAVASEKMASDDAFDRFVAYMERKTSKREGEPQKTERGIATKIVRGPKKQHRTRPPCRVSNNTPEETRK